MKTLRVGIQQAAQYLLPQHPDNIPPTGDTQSFNSMGAALDSAFADARLDIIQQISEGDTIVTRAVSSATTKPSSSE